MSALELYCEKGVKALPIVEGKINFLVAKAKRWAYHACSERCKSQILG